MAKLFLKKVSTCKYCPNFQHIVEWNLREDRCHLTRDVIIEDIEAKNYFPSWCPLDDVDEGKGD